MVLPTLMVVSQRSFRVVTRSPSQNRHRDLAKRHLDLQMVMVHAAMLSVGHVTPRDNRKSWNGDVLRSRPRRSSFCAVLESISCGDTSSLAQAPLRR